MKHIAAVLAVVLIFGCANAASAAEILTPLVSATTTFFNFTWTTVASFFQTDPSGTTTTADGTRSGSANLAVTQTADGFVFSFDGAGGHGSGSTNAAGVIANEGPVKIGSFDYPFPANVPDVRPGTDVSQGQLTITGRHVTLAYTDLSHSNTFGPNLSTVFQGTGVVKSPPTVSAPEPLVICLVGVALSVAVVIRPRRVTTVA